MLGCDLGVAAHSRTHVSIMSSIDFHLSQVKLKSDTERIFALRVLKKKIIINSGQQEHVLREGRILMEAHCPFIVRYLLFAQLRWYENVLLSLAVHHLSIKNQTFVYYFIF